jgi:hypothetical protein
MSDTSYQEPIIVKQGIIQSAQDLVDLHIIDWKRSTSWESPRDAMRSISSWFINRAGYAIFHYDLRQAPMRDDWPGWNHVGGHEYYGRLFWNDFYWRSLGTLTFSDSPDFFGTMVFPDKSTAEFWGDIGQVSATTFSQIQKDMRIHDVWISILDVHHQIFIETLDNIAELFASRLSL